MEVVLVESGDILFLYTDGIVEAEDEEGICLVPNGSVES
jgi:serine phosphatase RsbU (regulator of sigma subunit)